MKKKSLFALLMTLTLVFTPYAHSREMEAESGASKLHVHGYGELHYNMPTDGGTSKMDLHRMLWGVSYEFSDSVSLHTEVDFEHAAQEMELEFAYVDFLIKPSINFRSGVMLMPVGSLNETHEPPLFYSVERPLLHSDLIPTTWQEGGIGVFGSPMEGLNYRVYLVNGLAGEGFSAKKGIRGGRSKVDGGKHFNQAGEKLAVVARLEYSPMPGYDLGASYYNGGVNQVGSIAGDPGVGIFEIDGRVRMSGIDFQATYVQIDVDDADMISAVASCKTTDTITPTATDADSHTHTSTTTCQKIGSKMTGWYAELAYHLQEKMGTHWDLVPFIRLSEVNTQDSVQSGVADPANDREVMTYGLALYPHPNIAFKVDFQNTEDAAGGDKDQYNLGLAYMF